MKTRRADFLALLLISAGAFLSAWPLLSHPLGLPPDNEDLGLDAFVRYGFAGAARQVLVRYRQFPLRSPWHGGGYPIYANPDDVTLTPTMLLVAAFGPWAGMKVDLVLTMLAAGAGMYFFTSRQLGYPVRAALFSATAFACGGFLTARWLRGWQSVIYAAWLPLIMYALRRGRERRRWLALAALLVGWLFIDQKYVAPLTGWFLVMVGLLGLGEDEPARPGPPWGHLGRTCAVWAFGAGLAAVKLVPMSSLVRRHLAVPGATPAGASAWRSTAVWGVIFAALALTPRLGRLLSVPRLQRRGAAALLLLWMGTAAAVAFLPPRRRDLPPPLYARWEETFRGLASFGSWERDAQGRPVPVQEDGYRFLAPVGPAVLVLAAAAVFLHPGRAWRWALLAGLFLFLEVGDAFPRVLRDTLRYQPLVGFVRKPRQLLNFYLYFLLIVLAGRALDWRRFGSAGPPGGGRRLRILLAAVAWMLVAGNALYLGWETRRRLAYTVRVPLPPEPPWGPYRLLDRPADRWRDQPALLLRKNVALIGWDLDFRDLRHAALAPTLLAADAGSHRPNPDFEGMALFDHPENRARLVELTPNRIVVETEVHRPDVLRINQIADAGWTSDEGRVVPGALLLSLALEQTGTYRVTLRYRPRRLFLGLAVSAAVALAGLALLAAARRRRRTVPIEGGNP